MVVVVVVVGGGGGGGGNSLSLAGPPHALTTSLGNQSPGDLFLYFRLPFVFCQNIFEIYIYQYTTYSIKSLCFQFALCLHLSTAVERGFWREHYNK